MNAVLVTDALGRRIDGNDDGRLGGGYIATFGRTGATVGGVAAVRTLEQPATVTAEIDSMLARGEVAVFRRSLRIPRTRSDPAQGAEWQPYSVPLK